MAVTFGASGAWATLTADGAVTIPGSPVAGDRMWLWVAYKDQSVTINSVAGNAGATAWSNIANFADGAVGSGNGTGSMRVQVFQRDWVSGDGNPTIDFSAGVIAQAVIWLIQKGAGETWDTPLVASAAWPDTATSVTVTASATVDVPDGSLVGAIIALRDDSATFTRTTTTGIFAVSGVTWNGNYAEQPATHGTTTTGNDMAADTGYRLVTTGGAAISLRATATISANETGSVVWVVQGSTAGGGGGATEGNPHFIGGGYYG